MNVEQEIRELKAQLAAAVKRIAELEDSFGYISGQLRELQMFLHNDIDARLTSLETECATASRPCVLKCAEDSIVGRGPQ